MTGHCKFQTCDYMFEAKEAPFLHPPTSTVLASTTLLRTHHHSHPSLYIPCTWVTGFVFVFLTLEFGTDRLF